MPTDLRSALANYAFPSCRDLGHRWTRPVTYATPGEPQTVNRRRLTRRRRCEWCETERYEQFLVLANSAQVIRISRGSYSYPEGYRLKGFSASEAAEAIRFTNLYETEIAQ